MTLWRAQSRGSRLCGAKREARRAGGGAIIVSVNLVLKSEWWPSNAVACIMRSLVILMELLLHGATRVFVPAGAWQD